MSSLAPLKLQLTGLHASLVFISGTFWCVLWLVNQAVMSPTRVAAGIDLVFLPAGYRLLIVLIFGFWGALGISLFDPLMFVQEFGTGSTTEIMINALITGFVPYLTVVAFCKSLHIQPSLSGLRPAHLPLLAILVSIMTPLFYNLNFTFNARQDVADFPHNFFAMATGDFLGCLVVLMLTHAVIKVARLLHV